MESLLEFLFGNSLLIIILIGVISTFLGKRKKTDETSGRDRRMTIPDVIRETLEKQSAPAKRHNEQTEWPERTKISDIEVKLEQARDVLEQKLPDPAKSPVIYHKSIEETEISDYKPNLHFDRQKLIDGIIMSEVLGPPKSRMNKRR
ncbi:hypothetical protein ELQ35_12790 [Peribacillus cavernae]|uniref:Uncharacterized protein n=1 Tax=Peribacillus cavernae TaxID=1674310 RepID=A0A433HJS1_9BACI|nr:hypothetical protein [Peribacillus cavernae]MDQ0218260.1 hypothetical protein [Peribacillus cavernae]RUQ28455.1 hypothetical protein ELQ35_12790 [Peribacillus cavernae]